MSHNLIINTAKAALTAVTWLLKLLVTIASGCVSVLFAAMRHEEPPNEDADPYYDAIKRGIKSDVGDGLY